MLLYGVKLPKKEEANAETPLESGIRKLVASLAVSQR